MPPGASTGARRRAPRRLPNRAPSGEQPRRPDRGAGHGEGDASLTGRLRPTRAGGRGAGAALASDRRCRGSPGSSGSNGPLPRSEPASHEAADDHGQRQVNQPHPAQRPQRSRPAHAAAPFRSRSPREQERVLADLRRDGYAVVKDYWKREDALRARPSRGLPREGARQRLRGGCLDALLGRPCLRPGRAPDLPRREARARAARLTGPTRSCSASCQRLLRRAVPLSAFSSSSTTRRPTSRRATTTSTPSFASSSRSSTSTTSTTATAPSPTCAARSAITSCA